MYASRSRCDSALRSTFATSVVPSASSTLYTSPMQPPPIGRAPRRRSPKVASISSAMIFSNTAVAPLTDNLRETSGCLFREVHDAIEALGTPVAAESRDRPEILLVYDQHVVEPLTILGSDPASPPRAEPRPRALFADQASLQRGRNTSTKDVSCMIAP